jgi:hypothetical protein
MMLNIWNLKDGQKFKIRLSFQFLGDRDFSDLKFGPKIIKWFFKFFVGNNLVFEDAFDSLKNEGQDMIKIVVQCLI